MTTEITKECQHEFQSLPLVDLRTVQYVCMSCETFFDVGIDPSASFTGKNFHDMHTQIASGMGYTYKGETTYERLRERNQRGDHGIRG